MDSSSEFYIQIKYITIYYYYICEKIVANNIELIKIPTVEIAINNFTKSLLQLIFKY